VEEVKNKYSMLKHLKGRGQLGDLGVDGNIILKRFLKQKHLRIWTYFNCLKIMCNVRLI
jgi:hypothetical protein